MGEDLWVLAMSSILAQVEQTCHDLVWLHLEDEGTVGMRVELDHLGSFLVGMWIEVSARVVVLAGLHIETAVAVCDALGPVGHAHHTRFVIDRQRERLAARRTKAAAAL